MASHSDADLGRVPRHQLARPRPSRHISNVKSTLARASMLSHQINSKAVWLTGTWQPGDPDVWDMATTEALGSWSQWCIATGSSTSLGRGNGHGCVYGTTWRPTFQCSKRGTGQQSMGSITEGVAASKGILSHQPGVSYLLALLSLLRSPSIVCHHVCSLAAHGMEHIWIPRPASGIRRRLNLCQPLRTYRPRSPRTACTSTPA